MTNRAKWLLFSAAAIIGWYLPELGMIGWWK